MRVPLQLPHLVRKRLSHVIGNLRLTHHDFSHSLGRQNVSVRKPDVINVLTSTSGAS